MRFFLTLLGILLVSFDIEAKVSLIEKDIERALLREFEERGIDSNIELEIFGGKTSFDLEDAENVKIFINHLKLNEEQNKFTADAAIFADGKQIAETELLGRYFVMAEVWLPSTDIAKDELINEGNLQRKEFRSNRLRDDMVVAKEDLLGKQVIRNIKAGKPVTERDIRDEIIVKRGQSITAVYMKKGLQITSKTEAMEDGAKGQRIKLLNVKSGKEIIGRILDKNTAEITAE